MNIVSQFIFHNFALSNNFMAQNRNASVASQLVQIKNQTLNKSSSPNNENCKFNSF